MDDLRDGVGKRPRNFQAEQKYGSPPSKAHTLSQAHPADEEGHRTHEAEEQHVNTGATHQSERQDQRKECALGKQPPRNQTDAPEAVRPYPLEKSLDQGEHPRSGGLENMRKMPAACCSHLLQGA